MFFLVLISLERAFALIWPLLHRTTSTKTFIYGLVSAWLAGVSLGSLIWLVSYGLLKISHYTLTFSIVIVWSLATTCTSYLAIRKNSNAVTLLSKQNMSDKSLCKTQENFPKLCSFWQEHLLPSGFQALFYFLVLISLQECFLNLWNMFSR